MTAPGNTGYAHDALFYDSDAGLLAAAVPFLRAGLAAGDAVALVCHDRNIELLTDALGGDRRIRFLTPAHRIRASVAIANFRRMVEADMAAGVRRVRLLGDVVVDTDPDTVAEWGRLEAAGNIALAPYSLWTVCAYDVRALPEQVLTVGRCTHTHLLTPSARTTNAGYVEPAIFLRRVTSTGADPLGTTTPAVESGDLADVTQVIVLRDRIRIALTDLVPATALSDFVAAVSEITTNGILHGLPPTRVRVWASAQRLLCRVTDQGGGFDDPLAGYAPICGDDLRHSGRGLWLARQLCDRVEAFPTREGFTVEVASSIPLAGIEPASIARSAWIRSEVAARRTANARARAADLLQRSGQRTAAGAAIERQRQDAARTLVRLYDDAADRRRDTAQRRKSITDPGSDHSPEQT